MTDTVLSRTTSLCATCKRSIEAEVLRRNGTIVMAKRCPEHGAAEVLLSPNADWYEETLAYAPALTPPVARTDVSQGCPFDCGPCTSHEQRLELPIVPVTSACNLDCPICYTHNQNEGAYHMSEAELARVLEHLRRTNPERRIINLTGGEPTQHPAFERLVELCHSEGIQRITISTHGMRFLKDEWLLERLATLDARVILSFDSLDASVNKRMLGGHFLDAKLRVLSLLEKHGVSTTLLPVVARGVNDGELGALLELALSKDFIRSVELHTMTFTGQGGADFDRAARYSPYEVLADLERLTSGALRIADFVPSPAAHPLCYQVTYLLRLTDGRFVPFPRFMQRADLRELLVGTLYLSPSAEMERKLGEIVNRLWAGDIVSEHADAALSALRSLSERLAAPGLSERERLHVAEAASKAVYVHAHMDEETFDTDRIRKCCVGIREPDGANVPSCAYNVLYRNRDRRFSARPEPALVTLGRGRTVS